MVRLNEPLPRSFIEYLIRVWLGFVFRSCNLEVFIDVGLSYILLGHLLPTHLCIIWKHWLEVRSLRPFAVDVLRNTCKLLVVHIYSNSLISAHTLWTAAICRRSVVTSPTKRCSFLVHPPRPDLKKKCEQDSDISSDQKPTRKFYTSIFSSCRLVQWLILVLVQRTRWCLLMDVFC